jgi:hypothetical protein
MSLIICEGMDNSGKSTLVSKLHEDLDIPIIKPPSFNKIWAKGEDAVCDYILWLIDLCEQSKNMNFIMDRHPIISTAVYEPVLFGRNNLESHFFWPVLKHEFEKCQPFIVYCRPSNETIKNFGNRAQMKGVIDHADALINQYDVIIDNRYYLKDFCRIFFFDWEEIEEYDILLNVLRTWL